MYTCQPDTLKSIPICRGKYFVIVRSMIFLYMQHLYMITIELPQFQMQSCHAQGLVAGDLEVD
jgi:hypothetical protein